MDLIYFLLLFFDNRSPVDQTVELILVSLDLLLLLGEFLDSKSGRLDLISQIVENTLVPDVQVLLDEGLDLFLGF